MTDKIDVTRFRWLTLLMAELDKVHDEDHAYSYDPCDCYERLRDGLDGIYRFPEKYHNVECPPEVG